MGNGPQKVAMFVGGDNVGCLSQEEKGSAYRCRRDIYLMGNNPVCLKRKELGCLRKATGLAPQPYDRIYKKKKKKKKKE